MYTESAFSCDEIFYYFESLVRGIMATWCFSNNSFPMIEQGKKYIEQSVRSIYKISIDE